MACGDLRRAARRAARSSDSTTDDSDTPASSASRCAYSLLSDGVGEPLEDRQRRGDRRATVPRPSTGRGGRPCGGACTRRAGRAAASVAARRRRRAAATKSAGSSPSRQDQHDRLDREPLLERERALGRACPGLVRVEREHHRCANRDASRKCPSPSAVPHVATVFSTPACDHPDHVGVALDDEDLARAGDRRLARAVQVVQDLVLAVDRASPAGSGTSRLRSRAVARQDPGADPDRPARAGRGSGT